ncbi:hypothetical protein V8E55_010408 [Tylopilus felleus]
MAGTRSAFRRRSCSPVEEIMNVKAEKATSINHNLRDNDVLHNYPLRENSIHAWNQKVTITVDDDSCDEGVQHEAWSDEHNSVGMEDRAGGEKGSQSFILTLIATRRRGVINTNLKFNRGRTFFRNATWSMPTPICAGADTLCSPSPAERNSWPITKDAGNHLRGEIKGKDDDCKPRQNAKFLQRENFVRPTLGNNCQWVRAQHKHLPCDIVQRIPQLQGPPGYQCVYMAEVRIWAKAPEGFRPEAL